MTKQILKYLMAFVTIVATTSIANAQSIGLGHTTPAANTTHAGGLSYTYAIGRIGRLITTNNPSSSPNNDTKEKQSANTTAKALTALAYPNPCIDYIKIKSDAPIIANNAKIQIIDSKGSIAATIDQCTSDGGEISIDLSHLASGKYVIRIITNKGIYTATAIKI
ncbi:MAG: T9SS type A sorting domain-containing protein [Bacteroidales bacterium]|nr:T9SS type A sorting domain-containing protein [Bacteroidales bacterium]